VLTKPTAGRVSNKRAHSLLVGIHDGIAKNLEDDLAISFFLLQCWGLNSGPKPRATPPALFFVLGIFEIGS
jgi:hypothetical protein